MKAALRGFTDLVAIPYLAALVVFLTALILSVVAPPGSSIERVIGAPVFGLPILIGGLAGYVINRKRFLWTAIFAWVAPAVVFWIAYTELTQSQNLNPQPWRNLVGADCASSECLYELLATVPLVCGVAYSVMSLAMHVRRGRIEL
jgi:hypothetical protein